MFHIKDDRRALQSAECICGALNILLGQKKLSDISITEIQKTAGVGRTTFYRLFDNVSDVLTYQVEKIIGGGLKQLEEKPFKTSYQNLYYCLEIWSKNKEFLMNLAKENRIILLRESLKHHLKKVSAIIFPDFSLDNIDPDFLVNGISSLLVDALELYIETKGNLTIDELMQKTRNLLIFLTKPLEKTDSHFPF